MSTNHIKQSLEMKCCRIFTTSNVRCSIECVCNSSGGVDIDQMQSSGKRGGGHSMKQSVLPFDLFISPSAAPANNYFPSLVVFFVFVLVIVFLLVRSCLLISLNQMHCTLFCTSVIQPKATTHAISLFLACGLRIESCAKWTASFTLDQLHKFVHPSNILDGLIPITVNFLVSKEIKHRKNCECCPVSQLIVR